MEEENKNDVELSEMLEDTSPDVEQEALTEEVPQEETPQEETPQSEMSNVRFKTLRDGKKEAEKQRDAYQRELEEMRRALQPQQQPQQQEDEEDFLLESDSIVEGRHLTKYDKKFKEMKEEHEAYKRQVAAETIEARILAKHPDYASVVTDENVAMFKELDPAGAATIGSSSDFYNKALTAYASIKRLGISSGNINQQDIQAIQKNANKPRSTQSINARNDSGPISQANAFSRSTTEEENARIYAQALEYKRNM